MSTKTKSDAPVKSEYFDKAYHAPITFWGDVRIPKELKDLVETCHPKTSLELGCGLGRFSAFMAGQGIKATGVDFSSVAIEKARKRVANVERKPTFMVGDVTNLKMIAGQFDVSFDVGCFHCLNEQEQQKYVSEVYRLLKPGATHLLWTMDHAPSDMLLNPNYVAKVFANRFQLAKTEPSRRRIISSHWYWLVRVQ
ncbi:MAG: methyltransferase domain-containing protein [Anaerolineales bacterium]